MERVGYYNGRIEPLEQLMIPAANLFEPVTINGVGAVLSIDKFREQNIELLHSTLYGEITENMN